MSSVVLDASFLVKLLVNEANSAMCQAVFEAYRAAGTSFLVPGHAAAEVLEVIRRKFAIGAANQQHLAQSPNYLAETAEAVPISELADRAILIAVEHRLTVYDALYIALSDREQAILLTCDLRLVERVRTSGFAGLLVGVGETGLVYHGSR